MYVSGLTQTDANRKTPLEMALFRSGAAEEKKKLPKSFFYQST